MVSQIWLLPSKNMTCSEAQYCVWPGPSGPCPWPGPARNKISGPARSDPLYHYFCGRHSSKFCCYLVSNGFSWKQSVKNTYLEIFVAVNDDQKEAGFKQVKLSENYFLDFKGSRAGRTTAGRAGQMKKLGAHWAKVDLGNKPKYRGP